jgi:hypothetical protein
MAKKKSSGKALNWLLFPFLVVGGLLLPFLILVWGSVLLTLKAGLNPWLGLGISLVAALGLVFLLLNRLSKFLSGKKKVKPQVKSRNFKVALVLMGLLGIYVLFFVRGGAQGTQDIHEEYTSLHPTMRMAVGILVLLDQEAVITDLARSHGDYASMGLPEKKKSLHYVQADGYVHALDFRTRDRAEWKNKATALYFRLLGFNTLRHIGTGDHLHVSLSAPGVPGI